MKETGIGIQNPIFFIGVIENNIDERLEGRVQVRAFGIHGTTSQIPTTDLPWATVVASPTSPMFGIPAVNSWVFGLFLDGRDAQQPMILGVIPTQMIEPVDPSLNGWGAIPSNNANLLSLGSRPEDIGQPQVSKLARGEQIEETYVLSQEMNRRTDIQIADSDAENQKSFDEPISAYGAEYPFNHVIETASGHSIEMDDTPGAERIMINHKTGSYIQIDGNGTVTHKAVGDNYVISDNNCHAYIGGQNIVTIDGDSRVLIKGDKIEEVYGDYKQIIHGNHLLSIGGQGNIVSSDELQIRSARLKFDSNVQSFSFNSSTKITLQSAVSIDLKAPVVRVEGVETLDMKSETVSIHGSEETNIKGDTVKIGGGAKTDISSDVVNIDDFVNLANGDASTPSDAVSAESAETTELPPPPIKSTKLSTKNSTQFSSRSSGGGYVSRDDAQVFEQVNFEEDMYFSSVITDALKPLLSLISFAEGANYKTIFGGSKLQPPAPITSLSVSQVLDWQDRSVAAGSSSSAAGKYQIIRSTLRTLVNQVVVSPQDIFNSTTQDQLAISLLEKRGLNSFLSNRLSADSFALNLSKEWASLPVPSGPNKGYSYYEGLAGNKARTDVDTVLNTLSKVKETTQRSSNGDTLV